MMKHIRYWHILIIIAVGGWLIAQPIYEKASQRHEREQILKSWEALASFEQFRQIESQATALSAPHAEGAVQSSETNGELDQDQPLENASSDPSDTPAHDVVQINGYDVDGVISIDKIELQAPIIRGTSKETLAISITSMNDSLYPGDLGNYALAGHRAYTYGVQFNRLLEVEIGDTVVIDTLNGTFVYTVADTFLVTPDEVWVLDSDDSKAEITLITCHPLGNPTHRFIVRGNLTETLER